MRYLILGLLVLGTTVHAAPSAKRCARACHWAAKHCGAFGNPTPARCRHGLIARCNATEDRACSAPSTTSTTTSSHPTTTTPIPTTTTTVTQTTSTTTATTLPLPCRGGAHGPDDWKTGSWRF